MKYGKLSKIQSNQNGEFMAKLLSLVLPIAFQQFMLSLVSASDAVMLGRLTQDALSAVSLAGQVAFVQNLFLAAMTIGLSVLAAQYWGKKDIQSVECIFAYVFKITVTVSALFMLMSFLFPEFLMQLFTQDKILIVYGATYLRVVSLSYLLTGISQIFLCILKNSGKALRSSIISSVSVIANIVLNAVLIFGLFGFPRMEIAGAALATVIARFIETIWCCLETAIQNGVKLRFGNILKDNTVLRHDFWQYTFPILGNEVVWGIGFTMYSVIMGHLGSDAVAANSIANIVKNLIACLCIGLGNGSGIMVGAELGAGRLEKARTYGNKLCRLSVMLGIISGIVLLILAPVIPSFANLSSQSAFYLKWMLAMCSYYMIGRSVNGTTIAGIFCAGGDSRFGFFCDAVTMWCVTVPLGCLAAFVFHLPVLAVFFIINLDEIVKLPAVYLHYKKYLWVRNLTK